MAKRSQKRILRKGHDQAGCMWGFISMFDFRTGRRTTKRLLSDKRRMSVQAIVAAHLSNQKVPQDLTENIPDCEESKVPMIDTAESNVKEHIEEQMFNDQCPTDKSNVSEMGLDQIDLKQEDDSKTSKQKPLDILDIQTIVEEFARNYRDDNNPDAVVDEKIVVAIKHYIEERSSDSKNFAGDGKSKDLTDVLRTLSTNKISFLKLLQDPNSRLVQHIHSLDDSSLKKSLSRGSSSSEDKSLNKHHSFFRRRSKSMEINPVGMGKDSQQPSNKIVVLKPGPTIAKSLENDISRNPSSKYSFTEIKRKLRHAMGKERRGISCDALSSKSQNGETLGWSSPNRNHFYTERFATLKKSEEAGTMSKDKNLGVVNENLRPGVSGIYIEAKKQISEILNNVENLESTTGGSKRLGRILSFSDYNSSSSDTVEIDEEEGSKHQGEEKIIDLCSESDSDISTTVDVSDGDIREIDEDTAESELEEHERMTNSFSSESDIYSITGDIGEVDKEEIASEEDLFGDAQTLYLHEMSPSCSLVSKEVEDSENGIDKRERPSPISVLEPLFTDDEISPARTISQPGSVGRDTQPRRIHFELQSNEETWIRISNKDEESAFEYVEALLLASNLNWDEFLLRWLSTYEILDSYLFDEVELFSSRSYHDQKLLFDCANDALREVCESCFGGFIGVSKKDMKAVPNGMDLINGVWDWIDLRFSWDPQFLSLDQLVKNDMPKHGKWMKLQPDVEAIGFEIGEDIFDELIEDTLSFLDDDSISEVENPLQIIG